MISANALGDVIRNLSVEYKYLVVESKYCVFVLFIFRTGLGVASEFRIGNAVDGTGPVSRPHSPVTQESVLTTSQNTRI